MLLITCPIPPNKPLAGYMSLRKTEIPRKFRNQEFAETVFFGIAFPCPTHHYFFLFFSFLLFFFSFLLFLFSFLLSLPFFLLFFFSFFSSLSSFPSLFSLLIFSFLSIFLQSSVLSSCGDDTVELLGCCYFECAIFFCMTQRNNENETMTKQKKKKKQ